MSDERQSDLVYWFGLWSNKSEKTKYLSGSIGGLKVLVFPTREKRSENSPDYHVYVAPKPLQHRNETADDTAAESSEESFM